MSERFIHQYWGAEGQRELIRSNEKTTPNTMSYWRKEVRIFLQKDYVAAAVALFTF
jgi:hypothetical protein